MAQMVLKICDIFLQTLTPEGFLRWLVDDMNQLAASNGF
ncbi:hypothetical protein AM1_5520 [Acaryochloris marina MBIC11017]|uniref:Uncharacterized protein n=1 Tax=Acaryochloris marina (strain MBIC 11017) TaxID=329726 RepID=B0CDZ9_ACAM1|nr:hypothetical protein AM1_5520 [Acaryochloris marina MBIC11017]